MAGALLGLTPAVAVRRPCPPSTGGTRLLRLAALGLLRAGEQLASAVTRIWWPVALSPPSARVASAVPCSPQHCCRW
jgi:hypothetical protein